MRATCVALCVAVATSCAAADQTLVKIDASLEVSKINATDAKLTIVSRAEGFVLHLETGHTQRWPGVVFPAPGGRWDLSAFATIELKVRNLAAEKASFFLRVDDRRTVGKGEALTGFVELGPRETQTVSVPILSIKAGDLAGKLFGMRGYPWGNSREPGHVPQAGTSFDSADVVALVLFTADPKRDHQFEISDIRATGKACPFPPADKFFPFIDEFGQYIHRDWPGKTHSLEELKNRVAEEAKDLAANPGAASWNGYGGWNDGPTLKATGFFYVTKHQGKWWLVDPEGRLFFSQGIDCVTYYEGDTPIEERASWFRDLPAKKSTFAACYHKAQSTHGHYAGRNVESFNFAMANLMRKYGEGWKDASTAITHRRLRSWGINTIASWSEPGIYREKKTPYVVTMGIYSRKLEGSQGYWGKFADVFDESFAKSCRRLTERAKATAADPWCLGYFVDNELSWGNDTALATGALASPANQPAKLEFVKDLKARYGTIEKLNAAWGGNYASWDTLLAATKIPDRKKARADLLEFNRKSAETYFRTIREALKAGDPNHLYLGCRFAWVNDVGARAAAKYCDVVSYNLYRRNVVDFRMPDNIDMPVIIGEFHFGALDRGLFHTGLVPTASQDERAKAYYDYVAGALRNPTMVGCHWFKYVDEPTTGRPLDEENYQIGFLDTADTPYPEIVRAARALGRDMYKIRAAGTVAK